MTPNDVDTPEYEREDEAVRDGIEEEDNAIPRWFTWSFVGTLVFGAIYIPYYIVSGWSSAAQWQAEVDAAEAQYAAVRQQLPSENPFRGQATAIAEGKEVWATTCVACHKPDGTGLVGPSVVDPYWKYGNSDAELYESVANGRPLGMPPWGPQLGSDKIWKALAYMETLPKSNQPGVGSPDYQPPGS